MLALAGKRKNNAYLIAFRSVRFSNISHTLVAHHSLPGRQTENLPFEFLVSIQKNENSHKLLNEVKINNFKLHFLSSLGLNLSHI